MTNQCHYDLEAHLDQIITLLFNPCITFNISIISAVFIPGAPVRQKAGVLEIATAERVT